MSRKTKLFVAWLLLPSLLITLVFYLLPAVLTAAMSLTNMDYRLHWEFAGLANFVRMAQDFLLPRILKNTVVYTFATLALFNVGFAVVLALTTAQAPDRFGRVIQALWLLPRFTPPIVYGVIWMWILDPTRAGLLNSLLVAAGGRPVNWIAEYPMAVVVLTNGLVGVSFGMIIFYSAIKSIPHEYLWAAQADGASWLQQVRYVTLPLLRWPLLFVTAYQTLSLLTSYEYILILTQGGPFFATTVWALYAYNQAFGGYFANYQFGYGAALSVVLVVLGALASVVYWRVFRFREMMAEPKIEVD
ncbi:MAG: sugar ABC transporter permease [Limnochordales bacterium]|jgi:ABC-type sugar transport systems, permease components|nr:ABC transporter [Bacillota bacterium]